MARQKNADQAFEETEAAFEQELAQDENDEAVVDGEGAAEGTEAAATAASQKKHDLPENHVTPVGLAKIISKERMGGKELRPQMVYGWIKNSKDLAAKVKKHTDGRNIIHKDDGLAWFDAKEARKAERAAAAEAAATTEEAPVAEEEQPVDVG
jgi:hypothetical protein